MMPVGYELRCYGNYETDEYHFLVDGVEVSKEEYHRCLLENQSRG